MYIIHEKPTPDIVLWIMAYIFNEGSDEVAFSLTISKHLINGIAITNYKKPMHQHSRTYRLHFIQYNAGVYMATGKQELFDRSSTCSEWEIKQNNRFGTLHDRSILCFSQLSTGRTLIQPAEHTLLDERECKLTPSSGDRSVDLLRSTGS